MWLVDDEVVTRWGLSIFIIFISFIWHPWLMTKWHGHPIIITMLRKWLQVIWYEHKQPYRPTNLCTYLFTYLPTHPPTHRLIYLPTHPPTYFINLHVYLPTFYFLSPTTYLPPTFHSTICYLLHSLVMIWNKHVK